MDVLNFLGISPIGLSFILSIESLIDIISIINELRLFAIPIIFSSFLIPTLDCFIIPIKLLLLSLLIIFPRVVIYQLHRPIIIRIFLVKVDRLPLKNLNCYNDKHDKQEDQKTQREQPAVNDECFFSLSLYNVTSCLNKSRLLKPDLATR